jgi:hypothetical protein
VKALSIMQPWAWLVVTGRKDIENRDWPTSFRGPVLIHAGKRIDRDCADMLKMGLHPVTSERIEPIDRNWECGGIVGAAEIVGCVARSPSPWFVGRYGFVLRKQQVLPFQPLRGQLGFFDVPVFVMPEARHG